MKKKPRPAGMSGRGCCRSVAIAARPSASSFRQLVDHLNDAAGARLDQNRAAVHDGVAIVVDAVFLRHVIIGDAFLGQHGADANVLAVAVGGTVLFDHVAVEARTFIDAKHAIAHNKIMVIDGATVITGSFNFTKQAETENAENLLIIRDASIAPKYLGNFDVHLKHSEAYKR